MDRARLVGTAKEAVLVAMLRHDGYLSVKDILAIIHRHEANASVPAVYRALRLLEDKHFIESMDSTEKSKVMESLRQLAELGIAMPFDRAGDRAGDRGAMLFRLTDTGRVLGLLLRLSQGEGTLAAKDVRGTVNAIYALLAAETPRPEDLPSPASMRE